MAVTILDAWAQEDDYDTNGATFSVSAGSRRCAVLFIGGESNEGSEMGSRLFQISRSIDSI